MRQRLHPFSLRLQHDCLLLSSLCCGSDAWMRGVRATACHSCSFFPLFLLFLDRFEAHHPRIPTPNNEMDLKIMTLPKDGCPPRGTQYHDERRVSKDACGVGHCPHPHACSSVQTWTLKLHRAEHL